MCLHFAPLECPHLVSFWCGTLPWDSIPPGLYFNFSTFTFCTVADLALPIVYADLPPWSWYVGHGIAYILGPMCSFGWAPPCMLTLVLWPSFVFSTFGFCCTADLAQLCPHGTLGTPYWPGWPFAHLWGLPHVAFCPGPMCSHT